MSWIAGTCPEVKSGVFPRNTIGVLARPGVASMWPSAIIFVGESLTMKNRFKQLLDRVSANPSAHGSIRVLTAGIAKEYATATGATDWNGVREMNSLLETEGEQIVAACLANTGGEKEQAAGAKGT